MDPTLEIKNIYDSLRRHFITELQPSGFPVLFSTDDKDPDFYADYKKWINIKININQLDVVSSCFVDLIPCCISDDKFEVMELQPVVMHTILEDPVDSELNYKKIPLYNSNDWSIIGGFLITGLNQSSLFITNSGINYLITTVELKWIAKL